jgi:hypothetical protein
MPQLAALQKKYGPKGFILLGFYAQSATKDEIIAFCKANKVEYSIYDHGQVSGVSVAGIPHFVLFDYNGKMVFEGHPGEMGSVLEKIMKNAPDPMIGAGPYVKLKSIAAKLADHKNLGQTLATLKTKYLNSADANEKAEAEKLVAKLTAYGTNLMDKANKKKDSEPLNAFNLYQEVSTLFKGDAIGENADKVLKDLKDDKAFQSNMKADKILADMMPDIEKLKPCSKHAEYNKNCEACQKKNPSLEALMPKAQDLVKKYPDSPAAAKVKELLPVQ